MEDLAELPFERLLSYLSLEDRIRSRAVSRSWRKKFDFKLNSLCYSKHPIGFIYGKRRLTSGVFAPNLIISPRFVSFFDVFGRSILSNLKHLRICGLGLVEMNGATLTRAFSSFSQLEELALFCFGDPRRSPRIEFELNLPMLNSLQLKNFYGIHKLTVDAPKLRKIQLASCCYLQLNLVHGESVERLLADELQCIPTSNLTNLQYIHIGNRSVIDRTILSYMHQLKEFHLEDPLTLRWLFEQKQRYGRTNLKIYQRGYLLNGPDDPAISSFLVSNNEAFVRLAENPSRLADEMPFLDCIRYTAIERVARGSEVLVLKRLTELRRIVVVRPVNDIERFLEVLKNSDHLLKLEFDSDQPAALFNRLPEHCAVQWLTIRYAVPDLEFLLRMKHLIHLDVKFSIDAGLIRKLIEGLPFLTCFGFRYRYKYFSIEITRSSNHSEKFRLWGSHTVPNDYSDLNDVIQSLENVQGDQLIAPTDRCRTAYLDEWFQI